MKWLTTHKQVLLCAGNFLGSLLFASFAFAQQVPQNLNLSGGLFYPSGAPITNNNVNFNLEILDKDSTCVLYTERHNGVDLSQTKGSFSLMLGSGTTPVNNLDGSGILDAKVFQNSGATGAFTGCATGVTLASGDERVIRVSYDLGGGFVAMSPVVPIVSSAYAMVAETLEGHAASDFILTNANTSLSQTSLEYLFTNTNYASLKNLVDGSSSQYVFNHAHFERKFKFA